MMNAYLHTCLLRQSTNFNNLLRLKVARNGKSFQLHEKRSRFFRTEYACDRLRYIFAATSLFKKDRLIAAEENSAHRVR